MRGFTLIELMVVVGIIGILAGISLPAYQDYTIRSQIAEAMLLAAELKDDVRDVYKHTGRFPADNRAAGLPLAKHLIGNYVKDIEVENGALHIRLGNKANKAIAGKVLTLQPLIVAENPTSPISWNCGSSEPPEGMKAVGKNRTDVNRQLLPFACRGA
jgi:type IV pilus assembly protein PilA